MSKSKHSGSGPPLPLGGGDAPVPTFACIVLMTRREGQFEGRVANLSGVSATAATQRELLAAIVQRFKSIVAERVAAGTEPDWIEPPLAKRDDEQKLFLPVHL